MDITLPSGAVVTLRSTLKAKDKFAVQGVINVAQDGRAQAGILSLMESTLLARLIEAWTLPDPLPSTHSCPACTGNSVLWHEHVRDALGEAMDLDDFNELETQISPLLQKVMQAPNLETSSGSAASS